LTFELIDFMRFFKLTIFLSTLLAFFSFAPNARAAITLRPALNLGLVGYWAMDEGSGTKAGDSSGNGKNGTLTGTSWTTGKSGQAISFNGSSDLIDLGNVYNGVKTVSFWIKADSTTKKIINFSNTANVEVISGTITTSGITSPTIYVDGAVSSIIDTNWHHIAITTATGINASAATLGRVGWACGSSLTYNSAAYTTVLMSSSYGSQCWFGENLRTTKKPDGVTDITSYCDPAGCDSPWGRLYDWTTAMDGASAASGCTAKIQGICPSGWHIPSDYTSCSGDDFPGLGSDGGALKKTGTAEWWSPNTGATNDSNFTAYPAGNYNGSYNNRGDYGYFWSSSQVSSPNGYYRYLRYGNTNFSRNSSAKTIAYSIRCVKDDPSATYSYFQGKLDEVRMYSRVLSGTEVTALYNSGAIKYSTSTNTGLVGYWSMEEGSGTKVGDSSGNGNDGTISSVVATDNFDRANANPISGNWALSNGGEEQPLKIESGKVLSTTGAYLAHDYYTAGTFSDDQYSQVKIYGTYVGPAVRLSPAAGTGKGYTAVYDSGTHITVYTTFWVEVGWIDAPQWQSGDVLKISVTGQGATNKVIRVYVNGVQYGGEIRDPNNYGADSGRPGIMSYYGDTTTMDDWEGGNLPNWVDGKRGKALSFDGTSDYMNIPYNAAYTTNAITVSAWVKRTGTINDAHYIIVGNYLGVANDWTLELPSSGAGFTYNHLVFTWYTSSGGWNGWHGAESVSTFSSLFPLNEWALVTAVRGSSGLPSTAAMYINGTAISVTAFGTQAPPNNKTNAQPIGGSASGYNFPGSFDEIRIYNRALTSTEVANLYQSSPKITRMNSSQNSQLTSGLVGLWSFNGPDISGNTAYDRAGSNNGTISGASVTPGKVGQGMSFDGSDDFITIPEFSSAEGSAITVSAWMKLDDYAGSTGELIVSKFRSGFVQWYLRRDSTVNNNGIAELGFTVKNGSGTEVSATSDTVFPSDNNWHHVVGVYDGSNVYVYGDGISLDSTPPALTGQIYDYSNSICIGSEWSGSVCNPGGEIFDGTLDEVRIYSRALSAGEVQQLYNMGR